MPALRRLMTALLLLICLAPLGKPLGMVLCFGPDGHIAFEPVHTQAHSIASLDVQGLSYQPVATTHADVAHAHPCVDVTFLASDGSIHPIPVPYSCPKPETPMLVPMLVIAPISAEFPHASLLAERSPEHHQSLTILRSVVLHL